jgi:hypothetical protein
MRWELLLVCWAQWVLLSSGNPQTSKASSSSKIPSKLSDWSVSDVKRWLGDNGFSSDVQFEFQNNRVDGKLLLKLTENELSDLKISRSLDQKRFLLLLETKIGSSNSAPQKDTCPPQEVKSFHSPTGNFWQDYNWAYFTFLFAPMFPRIFIFFSGACGLLVPFMSFWQILLFLIFPHGFLGYIFFSLYWPVNWIFCFYFFWGLVPEFAFLAQLWNSGL